MCPTARFPGWATFGTGISHDHVPPSRNTRGLTPELPSGKICERLRAALDTPSKRFDSPRIRVNEVSRQDTPSSARSSCRIAVNPGSERPHSSLYGPQNRLPRVRCVHRAVSHNNATITRDSRCNARSSPIEGSDPREESLRRNRVGCRTEQQPTHQRTTRAMNLGCGSEMRHSSFPFSGPDDREFKLVDEHTDVV